MLQDMWDDLQSESAMRKAATRDLEAKVAALESRMVNIEYIELLCLVS